MQLGKGKLKIQSVEDWYRIAPPKKGILQWKDGRSAKELSKAWCGRKDHACPPDEFAQLLLPLVNAHQLENADGWPEHIVPIDDLPGEQPNIDLAIRCNGEQGRTVICVEAKADESFGKYVSEMRSAGVKKIKQGIATNAIKRIDHLEQLFFPGTTSRLPDENELRYQLFTGTAATLAFAKLYQAPVAVFVVHEFIFDGHVDEEKVAQNALDLGRFVTRCTGGAITSVPEGVLQGPVMTPLQPPSWGNVSLYIGKIRTAGTLAGS